MRHQAQRGSWVDYHGCNVHRRALIHFLASAGHRHTVGTRRLLADGTLHEYEVDTEAIRTETPGTFLIVYLAVHADGLDRVNAALNKEIKSNPTGGVGF